MSQLQLIIKNEYLTDIRSKGFWIATFALPAVAILFGVLIGFLADDSDTLKSAAAPTAPESNLSGFQIMGMLIGMLLTLVIMIYGAQIFNKVKTEKTNRVAEVLATIVPGRTLMLGKVIAVGLLGLTQVALFLLLGIGIAIFFFILLDVNPGFDFLLDPHFYISIMWAILYFIGGYLFYGAMFAVCGAMSDKNNENQEYMTIITFILLASFYIGQFSVDNPTSQLTTWCSIIPFTSSTVGSIGAIGEGQPLWVSIVSVVVLFASAMFMISLAGKIYTSALMLKGKKLSPKDLVAFFKAN